MSMINENLVQRLQETFGETLLRCDTALGEVTIEVSRESIVDVCRALRDDENFAFEQLIDLCGMDYLAYGEDTWQGERFAVVYHLLSVSRNTRLRVRAFVDEEELRIASVNDIWSSANWFEREAFDLYGILFEGHPDLRRLLTDYGFIGHPFRKDFPLIGQVEMRYDPERRRVVYEPVSIEPRINVPRVIREDNRYEAMGE